MATYEPTTSQTNPLIHEPASSSEIFGDQKSRELYRLTSVPPLEDAPSAQRLEAPTFSSFYKDVPTVVKAPRALPEVLKVGNLPEQDSYILLQKWQGVVKNVGEESFLAELRDLTSERPEEEAEFPIDEIPNPDRELIAVGAVFYWCIGYLDTLNGQRIRASEIRFRRVPAWTKKEIERARSQAIKLRDAIGWK